MFESQQDQDTSIPQDYVIKIVQLLGDIAGMRCGLSERKRVLMVKLSDMLDADGWLWSATQVIQGQDCPVSVGVIYGGLTDDEFAGWVEASQIATVKPPEDEPISVLFNKGQHFTRTRQQVVPDKLWYNHPTVKKFRLSRGIDHFLYSIYPLSDTHCSAVGFFRRVGKEPFNDTQRRVCHIIFSNVKWLHENSFPDHKGESCRELTPRLRTVLIYLLSGKQKDEIANLLYISPQTAKTHIRNIYKHFDVNSQVELMYYFRVGNGGDIEKTG